VNDDYYNSPEARLDTIVGNHAYWLRLRSAQKEYRKLEVYSPDGSVLTSFKDYMRYSPDGSVLTSFKDYMRDTYGIHLNSDSDGNILPTHTIVDEQKHLIFLLKHSKHEN
jgi:hypothetical protein